jgi:hypothetical protein
MRKQRQGKHEEGRRKGRGRRRRWAVRVVDEGTEGGENKCGMCVRASACVGVGKGKE